MIYTCDKESQAVPKTLSFFVSKVKVEDGKVYVSINKNVSNGKLNRYYEASFHFVFKYVFCNHL